jgi:hypothetical protein
MLVLHTRPMDRDRDAWILAAKLLALHGEGALDAVSIQLATLQRLVELKRDAEDAALLKYRACDVDDLRAEAGRTA